MAIRARRALWRRGAPALVGAAVVVTLLGGCGGSDSPAAPEPTEAVGAAADRLTASVPTAEPTTDTASGQPEPLVTASPDQYSEVGQLVSGFPVDLLPVPADAVILVTSAVPVGNADDVQEVSLNLRTQAAPEDLLALYRSALTAAGFSEVTSQTSDSDLAVDVTFVRSDGDEIVSIGVLDVDGARTVTIGGRVRH